MGARPGGRAGGQGGGRGDTRLPPPEVGGTHGRGGRRAAVGDRRMMPRSVLRGCPQFPGTDRLGGGGRDAQRGEAPEPAGRGWVGIPRGPCALPSPAAPRLPRARAPRHSVPTRDSDLWGPKGSPGSWVPSPIPRTSCVRGDPRPLPHPRGALLSPGELEPPVPHHSPSPFLLPPLRDFCPTNGVGRCRWTGLERRDTSAASNSPGVTPPHFLQSGPP